MYVKGQHVQCFHPSQVQHQHWSEGKNIWQKEDQQKGNGNQHHMKSNLPQPCVFLMVWLKQKLQTHMGWQTVHELIAWHMPETVKIWIFPTPQLQGPSLELEDHCTLVSAKSAK